MDPESLDVYFIGDGSATDIGVRNESNTLFPNLCLPNGIPPIWDSIEEKLLAQLDDLESLPIHDYKHQQRYVPRMIDAASLVKAGLMPPVCDISVHRDLRTGQLLGFTEHERKDPMDSASNSLSMSRAPSEAVNLLKGYTGHLPFWPGGIDLPLENSEKTENDDITDYRCIAPGLSRGLQVENKLKSQNQEALKITDLFQADDFLNFESSSDEEEPEVASQIPTQKENDQEAIASVEEDGVIEELTKDAKILRITEAPTIKQEVKGTEFAVKLDVNKPIPDFHQKVPDMAYQWPFELDVFQKQAVLCLENHTNVFVAAHTSSGKTVVAEYAIALCRKHMTKAIYTSPIKALSNQKFRDFKITFGDVGLITGDVQLNPQASCLIMTTEILRSMLYGGSDVIRDVEWVIFDEVHYINDRERGVVWEEVIIMLPDNVNIILLSATVPNYMEFADWVGRTKKRKVYVISTSKRPVPLEHYLYTGNSNKTCNELFLLVDSESKLQELGYKQAVAAKKERAGTKTTGPKGPHVGGHSNDKNIWLSVIEMLRKKEKLPAVAFTFSKKRIEENSGNLSSVDLTSSTEKSKIHVFIKNNVARLKGTDKELPQVIYVTDLLLRGIGIHHSGVLPILKEIIELLFQQGLIKILFATETFAMGVNMPARTVIFDSIRKHDGTCFRDLKPAEYIQMAGRAGRRGLDPTGTVIILCKDDVPELSDLHRMMLGKLTVLESQFRLTYTMILKLLRVEKLRIQDMLKRSFSEFSNQKNEETLRKTLHELRKKIKDIKNIDCYYCAQDIEQYYAKCKLHQNKKRILQELIVTHPAFMKFLCPGRVILLKADDQVHKAVVLMPTGKGSKTYKCLVLSDSGESWWKENLKKSMKQVHHHVLQELHKSTADAHIIMEIDPLDIYMVTNQSVKVNSAEKVIENYSRRQIPRFKDDPPSQSILLLIAELSLLTWNELTELSPVLEFDIRDLEIRLEYKELESLQSTLQSFTCVQCSSLKQHFALATADMELKDEYESVKYKLSDASLLLLPEYQERLRVLRELRYIDDNDNVQLKGKVACEISQQELLVTEFIFENITENMDFTEIAALLSCVVFEQKHCSEPNLAPSLKKGVEAVKKLAHKLGLVQKKYIRDFVAADYEEEFNFGLVEVVYEWARGTPFIEIITLTDVQEGLIVRCIQRLDELLRNVKDAARLIGESVLANKMEEASKAIKRDIVFAASLYTHD